MKYSLSVVSKSWNCQRRLCKARARVCSIWKNENQKIGKRLFLSCTQRNSWVMDFCLLLFFSCLFSQFFCFFNHQRVPFSDILVVLPAILFVFLWLASPIGWSISIGSSLLVGSPDVTEFERLRSRLNESQTQTRYLQSMVNIRDQELDRARKVSRSFSHFKKQKEKKSHPLAPWIVFVF